MVKTVGIVSLSSGIVGESFVRFESDIGIRRLKEYGLNVKFLPHALMGVDYIKAHPEKRAEDLRTGISSGYLRTESGNAPLYEKIF